MTRHERRDLPLIAVLVVVAFIFGIWILNAPGGAW